MIIMYLNILMFFLSVIEPIFVFVMSYLSYLTAELFHFSGIMRYDKKYTFPHFNSVMWQFISIKYYLSKSYLTNEWRNEWMSE